MLTTLAARVRQRLIKGTIGLAACLAFQLAHADAPPLASFPNTGAFSATWVKSQDDVAVIQLDGNYDFGSLKNLNAEPRAVVAREFLKRHADRYDFVVVFSTFEFDTGDATAFYVTVRNDTKGLGQQLFDNSVWFGSAGKLQGYIDMAALSRYVFEPTAPKFDEVLGVLSHELLHRWAARVRFRGADGSASSALLGRDASHWSFLLDSQGSVEYGNRWRDNGDGTFTSIGSRQYFSPLDLYLMGLIKKAEVPPFFMIENPSIDPARLPETGLTISGVRRNVSIDDIIAVEGERVPSADAAQRDFQIGFVLLARPGETVTDDQIAAVSTVRKAFQTRLASMTAGRAIAHDYLEPRTTETAGVPTLSSPVVGTGVGDAAQATAWLRGQQGSDGAWRDHALTGVRDTSVALTTLGDLLPDGDAAVTKAQSWLAQQALTNTDYLARRVVATGANAAPQDLATLVARQNTVDGGWGVATGYGSDVVDTAWAMLALARSGSGNAAALKSATGFLTSQQGADGGWPGSVSSTSRVAPTVLAVKALANQADAAAPLVRAVAYLAARQNTDGGFGDGVSTAHDTAGVISALATLGQLGAVQTDRAFAFIKGTQRSDGSWDGTAYSTASALGMLKGASAFDWAVAALQITPTRAHDGDLVQLRAKVTNTGTVAAPTGTLRLYDGAPSAGGTPIGADLFVPALAPGQSAALETRWDTRNHAGSHVLNAVVDPDHAAAELTRANNTAWADLQVLEAANVVDLAVLPLSVVVSPSPVSRLPQSVGVTATVANFGLVDALNVPVILRAGDGTVLDSTVVNLLGRSAVPVTLTFNKVTAGASQLSVVVDAGAMTADADRSNNSAAADITTIPTVDLAIATSDISTGTAPHYVGSDASIQVRARNQGTTDTPPFEMVVSVSDGTSTRELARRTLQIAAGSHADNTITWRVDLAGDLTISVRLDPSNSVSDVDASNNAATALMRAVAVEGANLATTYHDISLSPTVPLEGRDLVISTRVGNTGNAAASNVEVGLYDADPQAGGQLLAPLQNVGTLAAGASVPVSFVVPKLLGTADRLYFIAVDPAAKLAEVTRDDNLAFVVVSPQGLPDLVVGDGDLSSVPAAPKPGDHTTVTLRVANTGEQAAGSFNVRLYAGRVAAGNELAPAVRIAALAAKATSNASFAFDVPATSAVVSLIAVADADNEVLESAKDNNTAQRALNVQNGNAFVSERYFSPNGDGIKDSTVFGFRLSAVDTIRVLVVNAAGSAVRSFEGAGLAQISEGSVEWDGTDAWGRLVADGDYRFQVLNAAGSVVAEQSVSLDTNRLPIVRAFGTPNELYRNLTCSIASIAERVFTADEESLFVTTLSSDVGRPYQTGVYRMSAQGGDISTVFSNALLSADGGYQLTSLTVSERGDQVAFVKNRRATMVDHTNLDVQEIWAAAGDGSKLVRLATNLPDAKTNGYYQPKDYSYIQFLQLSADGKDLVAAAYAADGPNATIIRRMPVSGDNAGTVLFDGRGAEFPSLEMVALAPNRRKALVRMISRDYSTREFVVLDLETGLIQRLPIALFGRRDVAYRSGYWSPDSSAFVLAGILQDLGLDASDNVNFVLDVFDAGFAHQRRFQTDAPIDPTSWYGGEISPIDWASSSDEFVFGMGQAGGWNSTEASGRVYRAELSTGRLETLDAVPRAMYWSYFWSPQDRSVLAFHSSSASNADDISTYFLDTGTRRGGFDSWFSSYTGQSNNDVMPLRFSPSGRRFMFESSRDATDPSSACYATWGTNLYAFESLENLVADIQALRDPRSGGITLHGTASDAHLLRYSLDYSAASTPDTWHAIGGTRTAPVVSDRLALWVPPDYGTYFVRLTVEDLAGNVRQSVQRVSYSDKPAISNLQTDQDFISPNGDGVQDSLRLSYRVVEPVHLAFEVFDADGKRVRLVEKDESRISVDSYFEWDGRNDVGAVVPDGKYSVHVLDYQFDVEVDTTPPSIVLDVPSRPFVATQPDGLVDVPTLRWKAAEQNVLSYAYLENSGNGWSARQGPDISVAGALGAGTLTIADKLTWDDYTHTQVRLTVTDRAGNTTSITTPAPKGEAFLAHAYATDTEWTVEDCDGTRKTLVRTAPLSMEVKGPFPPEGKPDELLSLPFKGDEIFALEFVSTRDAHINRAVLKLATATEPDGTPAWTASRTLYSADPLFPVDALDGTVKSMSLDGVRVSVTLAAADDSLIKADGPIYARLDLDYDDGTSLSTNPLTLSGGGAPVVFAQCSTSAPATVVAPELAACNAAPSETMAFRLAWASAKDGLVDLPDRIEVERASEDGVSTSIDAVATANGWRGAFSVSGWPQGPQNIRVREYRGVRTEERLISFVVDHVGPSGEIVSPKAGQKLCASHVLDAQGTPTAFVPLLLKGAFAQDGYWAVEAHKAGDEAWQFVAPSGVVDSGQLLQPDADRMVAMTRPQNLADNTEQLAACALMGPDGCRQFSPVEWSSTKLYIHAPGENRPLGSIRMFESGAAHLFDGSIVARLHLYGPGGHQVCTAPVEFSVDGAVSATQPTVDRNLFSPNGDGKEDSVTLSAQLDEDVTVVAQVFSSTGVAVRTLAGGTPFGSGTLALVWDGRDDAGSVVIDGDYVIRLKLTDGCGNERSDEVSVAVDNTPPEIVLTSPQASVAAGIDLLVDGVISDPHFQDYRIDFASALAPNDWVTIGRGSGPLVPVHWSTAGLAAGSYLLRIQAGDTVDNVRTVTVPFEIATAVGLIAGISATPDPFSPNGDGRREQISIAVDFQQVAQAKIELFDASSHLLGTLLKEGPVAAGVTRLRWDGRKTDGTVAADGVITARVSAQSASLPAVSDEQAIQFVLDRTPPVITIAQPAHEYVTGSAGIVAHITDRVLDHAWMSVAPGGANGAWADVFEGAGAQASAPSASLDAYAEGRYGLKVTAVDQAENVAEVVTEFVIDRTPPKVSLSSPVAGAFVSAAKGPVNVAGVVEEKNLDKYKLLLAQGAPPATSGELLSGHSLPLPALLLAWDSKSVPDGTYALTLHAEDLAAQTGEASVSITVDNTPPVALLNPAGSPWYLHAGTVVAGSATDANFDSYTLEITTGHASAASLWTPLARGAGAVSNEALATLTALPPDGPATLRLTVTDKAGNVSQTLADATVDNTPPASPLDLVAALENRVDAHLTWRANTESDLGGYAVFRDGVRITPDLLASPAYVDAALKAGHYTYVVKAYDRGGLESGASNAAPVTVTVSQPVAKLYSPLLGGFVSGLVDVKGTANASTDFKEYRLYIGAGAAPASWQLVRRSPVPVTADVLSAWNTLGLSDGAVYSLKLEAEDLAGQVATDVITVSVDNTAPRAPIGLAGTLSGADATLTWTGGTESDLAGYILYRDQRIANATGVVVGPLTPYILTHPGYVDAKLPDGKHAFFVQAIDKAGNLSEPSNVVELSVDTHPPHVVITKPATGTTIDKVVYVLGTSDDTDIARVQFEYLAPGQTVWTSIGAPVTAAPWAMTWSAQGLPFGVYSLRAVATDFGGQTDPAPTPVAVRLSELDAPDVPTGLVARVHGGDATLGWTSSTAADTASYRVERTRADADPLEWAPVAEKVPAGVTTYVDANLEDAQYLYRVSATDAEGNVSKPSNVATALVFSPTLEQPYTPTAADTSAVQGATRPKLQLVLKRGDDTVAQVDVREDGTFSIPTLPLATGDNRLALFARDADGNESKTVAFHVVRGRAPAMPMGFASQVSGYSVRWLWQANTEADLLGYRVEIDGTSTDYEPAISAVSASSEAPSVWWDNEHGSAQNATDHQLTTGWGPLNYLERGNDWLEAQFAAPAVVTQLHVVWAQDGTPRNFVVEAFDGEVWVPLARLADNTHDDLRIKLPQPYRTDRIRLRVTSSDYPALLEFAPVATTVQTATEMASELTDGRHHARVSAVSTLALMSEAAVADAGVGDVTPPAAPVLTATTQASDVTLTWLPPQDTDVVGYLLRRDGQELLAVTNPQATTFVDVGRPNGEYVYTIQAFDAAGNASPESAPVHAVVSVDGVPAVVGLAAQAALVGRRVDLSWAVAAGPVPASFEVLRKAPGGDAFVTIATQQVDTKYADLAVENGKTYTYRVIGHDVLGNAGAVSNDASATPRDLIAPDAPVLVYPVAGGRTWSTHADLAELHGFAEPGARVRLSQNGTVLATVQAASQDATRSVQGPNGWLNRFSPAPDGTLAYVQTSESNGMFDLTTGLVTTISGVQLQDAQFGPNGDWALLSGYSDHSGVQHLFYWSRKDGQKSALATSMTLQGSPAVAPDGLAVAFNGADDAGRRGIWVMDPHGANARRLVADDDGTIWDAPVWSPDAARLAYPLADRIVVVRVDDGSTTAISVGANPRGLAWHPDGGSLIFDVDSPTGTRQLQRAMIDLASVVTLTPDDRDYRHAVIAPAGDQILAQADWSLVVRRLDTGNERVLAADFSTEAGYFWTQGGAIQFSGDGNHIDTVLPAGFFAVTKVALAVGPNVFGAVAIDDAGNVSRSAAAVTVQRLGDDLPDFSVDANDVAVVPAAAQVGSPVQVAVRVHNLGAAASGVPVTLKAYGKDGSVQAILSTTIHSVGKDAVTVLATWTPARSGVFTVTAEVDPARTITEQRVDNNTASRDAVVAGSGAPLLELSLGATHVPARGSATGTVTVSNAGPAFDGLVRLYIEDLAGYRVADLADRSVAALAFGESRALSVQWASGATLAGDYRLVADLIASDGTTVAHQQSGFTLDALRTFSFNVLTDQSQYEEGSRITLRGTVAYLDGNAVLAADAQTRMRILADGGAVLRTELQAASGLSVGTSASEVMALDASELGVGTYQAEFALVEGGQVLGQATASFTVVASTRVGLKGKFTTTDVLVAPGEDVSLSYALTNTGAVALADIPLHVRLVDVERAVELATQDRAASVLPGAQSSGAVLLAAQAWPLKTLRAQLVGELNGQTLVLDQIAVYVVDRVGPVASFVTPGDGLLVSALDGSVIVKAIDKESRVQDVEFSLDGLTWTLMAPYDAAAGTYTTAVPAGLDGSVSFFARAHDTSGNLSPTAKISVVVDRDPPQIKVSGLADGGLYRDAVAAQIEVTDAHLQSWTATLDGQPYTVGTGIGEGTHRLVVDAVDGAGNAANFTAQFVVDRTGPLVSVSAPTTGALLRAVDPIRVLASDAASGVAQVSVRVDGASPVALAEQGAGTYVLAGATFADGEHTLIAAASDRAGNASEASPVVFTIDTVPPAIKVTGVANGATYAGVVTPGVDVQDAHPGTFQVLLDGAAYVAGTPVSVAGAHTLVVHAVDLAGNPSDLTLSFTITVDTPTAAWQSPAGGSVARTPLVVTLTAQSAAGIEAVTGNVDGGASVTFVAGASNLWQATLSGLADGAHQINATARSAGGATATVPALTVVVDNTLPVIAIAGVVDGTLYRNAVTPTFTATDANLDHVSATLNGVAYVSGTPITSNGTWALDVVAVDKAGNAAHQTVGFTLAMPVLSGSLSVAPASGPAGSAVAIQAAATNVSNSSLSGTIKIEVRERASGRSVQTFSDALVLERGASTVRAYSWSAVGVQGAVYDIVYSLVTGAVVTEIDRKDFTVTAAQAHLGFDAHLATALNVLVFSQCRRAADDADGACTTRDYQADVSAASALATCDTQHANTLAQSLASLGMRPTVVTDEASFRQALRSDAYAVYWLSGNATTLRTTTLAELRANVLRGRGLVVEGLHDGRNHALEAVVGIRYVGKSPAGGGTLTFTDANFGAGAYAVSNGLVRVTPLSVATQAATLDDATLRNAGGIVTRSFGLGRTALIGFDLATTLLDGRDLAVWTQVMQAALTSVLPASSDGGLIAGGKANVRLEATNEGSPTSIQVVASLPAASSVVAMQPTGSVATVAGQPTVTWSASVSPENRWLADLQMTLPGDAGAYAVAATLNTVTADGAPQFWGTQTVTLTTQDAGALVSQALAEAQALSLTGADATARANAVRQIGNASLAISAGAWTDALRALLTAQGYLLTIGASPVTPAMTLGGAIAAVERKL
jgi:subtilase family serine protease/flagellar hook assembly protein FlgD